jgi:C-terminal processing protease CtpA/Prc
MVLKHALVIACVGFLCLAAPRLAFAQTCSGPGAAFGVTSYECEKCGLRSKQGRAQFVFNVEPRVLSVDDGSPVRVGDLVVSVDHHAITTPEGSGSFTYPVRGMHRVQVKRNGTNVVLLTEVTTDCSAHLAQPSAGAPPKSTTAELSIEVDTGKYGFALACRPSCTWTKGPNGVDYWTFDAEPPIVAVRAGTAAAAAGLKVGDKVVEVEGKPVLSPEGAWHLFIAQSQKSLTFTVERDGKRVKYTMRLK